VSTLSNFGIGIIEIKTCEINEEVLGKYKILLEYERNELQRYAHIFIAL
jgi:hypothetical protein